MAGGEEGGWLGRRLCLRCPLNVTGRDGRTLPRPDTQPRIHRLRCWSTNTALPLTTASHNGKNMYYTDHVIQCFVSFDQFDPRTTASHNGKNMYYADHVIQRFVFIPKILFIYMDIPQNVGMVVQLFRVLPTCSTYNKHLNKDI